MKALIDWKNTPIENAQINVRETGYNAALIVSNPATNISKGAIASRAITLYRTACEVLQTLDPDAEIFINSSYGFADVK